jgi:hypothetical protein
MSSPTPCRLAVGLVLALAPALSAQAPAQVKPERLFEQQIVLGPLGDASVQLRWVLPPREYALLLARLGPATKGKDKDGKQVLLRRRPAPESVLHYLSLAHLGLAIDGAKLTLEDEQRTITATFKARGMARTTAPSAWLVEVLDNARWYGPEDPPASRSIVLQTQAGRDQAGKPGVQVLLKSVQLDRAADRGARAVVTVVGGAKWSALKKAGAAPMKRELAGLGGASVWLAEEELNAAGATQVKELGLRINFWDSTKRAWLLPRSVTVALRR